MFIQLKRISQSLHLISKINTMENDDNMGRLLKGIHFACIKHSTQRRKDPEQTPYINHPVGVAHILYENDIKDIDVLLAAVLHDTIEDTNTTLEELQIEFGEKVAGIVADCTDDKSLDWKERKRLQIVTANSKSREAKLVKLADKIYNLKDLQRSTPNGWTKERVLAYFSWAKQVTNECRGISSKLDAILNDIYENGEFHHQGVMYKCIE